MGNQIQDSNEMDAIIDTTSSTIQIPDSMFTTMMQYEEKLLQDEFHLIKSPKVGPLDEK